MISIDTRWIGRSEKEKKKDKGKRKEKKATKPKKRQVKWNVQRAIEKGGDRGLVYEIPVIWDETNLIYLTYGGLATTTLRL